MIGFKEMRNVQSRQRKNKKKEKSRLREVLMVENKVKKKSVQNLYIYKKT